MMKCPCLISISNIFQNILLFFAYHQSIRQCPNHHRSNHYSKKTCHNLAKNYRDPCTFDASPLSKRTRAQILLETSRKLSTVARDKNHQKKAQTR